MMCKEMPVVSVFSILFSWLVNYSKDRFLPKESHKAHNYA